MSLYNVLGKKVWLQLHIIILGTCVLKSLRNTIAAMIRIKIHKDGCFLQKLTAKESS